MLRTTLLAIALCACGGGKSAPRPDGVQTRQGVDKDRAVAIAIDTGRTEGYDPALYDLKTAELEADTWRVYFELKPPGRPGGHFTVYVARDGTPRMFHGK